MTKVIGHERPIGRSPAGRARDARGRCICGRRFRFGGDGTRFKVWPAWPLKVTFRPPAP